MNFEALRMNYLLPDSKQRDHPWLEKVHPAMTMSVTTNFSMALDIMNDHIVYDDRPIGNGKSNNSNCNCDDKEIFSSGPSLLERQRSSSPRSVSGINSTSFFARDCQTGKAVFDTDKDDDCLDVLGLDPLPLMTSASTDLRNLMHDYLGPDVVKEIMPKTKLTFYADKEDRSRDIDDDIETDIGTVNFDTDIDIDDDEMTIDSQDIETNANALGETMLLPEWVYENDKQDGFLKFITFPDKTLTKSKNQSENKKMVGNSIRMKKKTKQKPSSRSKVAFKIKIGSTAKSSKKETNTRLTNNNSNNNSNNKTNNKTKDKATIQKKKKAKPIRPKSGRCPRIDEKIWNLNFMKLMAFYIKNGHSNVLRSDPDTKLSGWVKRQRNNLKELKLFDGQIKRLNDLDFVWDRLEGAWYEKYGLLKKFQKEEGTCEVPTKHDRSLAEWSQRQRREYRIQRSTMTRLRIEKLEGIPTWSWASRKERGSYRREAKLRHCKATRQNVQTTALVDDSESWCVEEEILV